MPNYNKLILAGHLTRDIETRHTQAGLTVGKGGIAVNHKHGDREDVCFLDFTAFGKQAEAMAKYLQKGRAVLLEGRLQLEQWEDKEGNKRSKHSAIVERFEFLGGRDDGDRPPRVSGGGRTPKATASDDIPF